MSGDERRGSYTLPLPVTNGRACFRLKCVLFHILSCFWGKLCLKIEFIFMFSFKGYNRRKFGEAHILNKAAAHSGTQTLAIGLIHHVKPARLLRLLADLFM